MLSSIQLINSFTKIGLAVDSSLSFLARTLLRNIPKKIVKVRHSSHRENSLALVSLASFATSCYGSSAYTATEESNVASRVSKVSSAPGLLKITHQHRP